MLDDCAVSPYILGVTISEWQRRAAEEKKEETFPATLEAVGQVRAMAQGEKQLHKAAMRTHAIHLLARRFPHHYPSERVIIEICGKDGLALIPAAENSFSVVLELHQPGQAHEPEPVFRIVKPDGSADLWPPQSNNGETPPS